MKTIGDAMGWDERLAHLKKNLDESSKEQARDAKWIYIGIGAVLVCALALLVLAFCAT